MIALNTIQCPVCHGIGVDVQHKCKNCNGSQFIVDTCEIDFEIPKGLIEDDNVILEGFGHADLSSKKRGNIIVKLQIERDEKFMRNIMINNDVKIDKRNLLVQVHI